MALTIYLAGPEVFLPNALEVLKAKAELVRKAGHIPVTPIDNIAEPADLPFDFGVSIYRKNKALMDRCDTIIANLTPYRGVGADPGTSFELGYMIARGAKAYGYSNVDASHTERCVAYYDEDLTMTDDGKLRGTDGLSIEAFEMADNLMLDSSIHDAGGVVIVNGVQDPMRLYDDLAAFEACLARL